jgi:hypothetical protein
LVSSSPSAGLTAALSGLSPTPVPPSALGAKGGVTIILSAAPSACAVPYVGGPINKPTTSRRSNPKGLSIGDASTALLPRSLPQNTPQRTTSVHSGKIVSIARGLLTSSSVFDSHGRRGGVIHLIRHCVPTLVCFLDSPSLTSVLSFFSFSLSSPPQLLPFSLHVVS